MGLNIGTLAPHLIAIFATSSESVETITSSNNFVSKALLIEYAINGTPLNSLIFLPGSLLLPDLAGIRAT
jgi:hypothetical protein